VRLTASKDGVEMGCGSSRVGLDPVQLLASAGSDKWEVSLGGQILDLGYKNISTEDDHKMLAAVLTVSAPTLGYINLNYNNIHPQYFDCVAEAISGLGKLKALGIGANRLDDSCVLKLVTSLEAGCPHLTQLNVNRNASIREEGASALAAYVLAHDAVTELNLFGCSHIGDGGRRSLLTTAHERRTRALEGRCSFMLILPEGPLSSKLPPDSKAKKKSGGRSMQMTNFMQKDNAAEKQSTEYAEGSAVKMERNKYAS
jgi:hypothetical protein